MKITTFFVSVMLLSVTSCQKEASNAANTETSQTNLEQQAKILKNDSGDSISVIYFAQGENVAVKLKKGGEEHELTAKGTSEKGEPQFSDGKIVWEIMEDGNSGRLTEKDGNSVVYR